MNKPVSQHIPREIQLHQKSRILSILFEDGKRFDLPCEYLRVFSRAAEVRTSEQPVTGKEQVNIERIEPQGQYAIRILFDDGHDTGLYSWDTLYDLGAKQESNWAAYLQTLKELGYERREAEGKRRIRLLYFAWLARKLRRESEELEIPPSVRDVDGLLTWLGRRRRGTAPLFARDRVRVTLNKQFAEGFTRIQEGDEIGIVPKNPTPPPTPDLP